MNRLPLGAVVRVLDAYSVTTKDAIRDVYAGRIGRIASATNGRERGVSFDTAPTRRDFALGLVDVDVWFSVDRLEHIPTIGDDPSE